MNEYNKIVRSGRIDSVSLKRDSFGMIKSAAYIVRERENKSVSTLHYMVRGCCTCSTKETVCPVVPVLLFMQDPSSIWEGYYCQSCGRWYWVRPMRASSVAVSEVRYLLKREGWAISADGERLIASCDFSHNSAVNKDRARASRLAHGDYTTLRKAETTLQKRASVVMGIETIIRPPATQSGR